MIKKILVPIDGSKMSLKAIDYAVGIGRHLQSQILLLNVLRAIDLPEVGKSDVLENSLEGAMENLAEGILTQGKEHCGDYAKVETRLEKGHPVKVILEVAEQEQFDMIVMGSSGISGIAELFLGSVSSGVLYNSKVPVTIVK